MGDNCVHAEAEWDWGEAQPAHGQVTVPGYCPECRTELERVYDHAETREVAQETALSQFAGDGGGG